MFEREFGPILLHTRIDWVIYLLVIVAKSMTGAADIQLPPWLQERGTDDNAILATLERLSRKPEGGA